MDETIEIGKNAHFGELTFLGGKVMPSPQFCPVEPAREGQQEIEEWFQLRDERYSTAKLACADPYAKSPEDYAMLPNDVKLKLLEAREKELISMIESLNVCHSTRHANASHYEQAASELGTEAAMVKAFAEAESEVNGFWPSGKPKIRIEIHKLKQYFRGSLSNDLLAQVKEAYRDKVIKDEKKINKTAEIKDEENWNAFTKIYELDPLAAIVATSFGMTQILGLNFITGDDWKYINKKADKHPSFPKKWNKDNRQEYEKEVIDKLTKFKDDMMCNEEQHLLYFVKICKKMKIDTLMKSFDWPKMAAKYNGPNYRDNHKDLGGYDVALAKYYLKHGGTEKKKAEDHIKSPEILRNK